jgi:hypothetical protein
MSVSVAMVSNMGTSQVAEVVTEMTTLLARLATLATTPGAGSDAELIDLITVYEKLRGALAAAQQAAMVTFAQSQVEAHIADGNLDPAAVGRGIGDQIAPATKSWPTPSSNGSPDRPTPRT